MRAPLGNNSSSGSSSSGSKMKAKQQHSLEPIETSKNKSRFSKKDLVEAVRRLTPGGSMSSETRLLRSFDAANEGVATRRGGVRSSPMSIMEWGVNLNARKCNELRTQADRKASALKMRLDTLRSLKTEQESLQKMLSADSAEAIQISGLLKAIRAESDKIDRRMHYRRQLEQMLRRLQKNKVVITSHVNSLDDAMGAAAREFKEMKAMLRQVEAGHTKAALELAEAQRLAKVEKEERTRTLDQRKIESQQAARMDAWRQKREIARMEFAAELRGDMSYEEEQKLQQTLTKRKNALLELRSQHEVRQKEASSLEAAFAAVRQATGVNSLDEVVTKFQSQEGNRRALATEKRDAEERLANAKRSKEELENRFADLQNSGIGNVEISREISEQLQREIEKSRVELKASNACCERLESVLVALRQGAIGLYQRLRPFGHLLEGEGSLPAAAMLPVGGAGSSATAAGGATGDAPSIDPTDAIHLCEIMLSKMVELISGGGEHGPGAAAVTSRVPPNDDDEIDHPDRLLPNPENNVRVQTAAQRVDDEAQSTTFITEADGDHPVMGGGGGGASPEQQQQQQQQQPASPRAVLDDDDDDDDGRVPNLLNASAETFEDMVPNRTFLKLSASRQQSEMLRRQEQAARKKRMLERIELAEETDRAAMSSRAARKKAQAEATDRLSTLPPTAPPPTRIKESAIERSVDILRRTPNLQ